MASHTAADVESYEEEEPGCQVCQSKEGQECYPERQHHWAAAVCVCVCVGRRLNGLLEWLPNGLDLQLSAVVVSKACSHGNHSNHQRKC